MKLTLTKPIDKKSIEGQILKQIDINEDIIDAWRSTRGDYICFDSEKDILINHRDYVVCMEISGMVYTDPVDDTREAVEFDGEIFFRLDNQYRKHHDKGGIIPYKTQL